MKPITLLLVSVLLSGSLLAQQVSKEELQRKNQDLAKEINDIRDKLNDTKNSKKVTLGLVMQLNRKIEARNQIIQNIKGEVYYIEKDIIKNYREIDTLKRELDTLKAQYAQSIVYAYKNRSNYDFLNFLFSASNFNDALKRISYLKSYRTYREQQGLQITKTKDVITKKIESLTGKRLDKSKALTEQSTQVKEIEIDKKEQDIALAKLQTQEKQLSTTIQKKERQRQEIASQIKKVIAAEIAKAKVEQQKEREKQQKRYRDSVNSAKAVEIAKDNQANQAPPNPPKKIDVYVPPPVIKRTQSELINTPEEQITSNEFVKNRGNMRWPLDKVRSITLRFGNNSIPAKPRPLIVHSDGVTFETDEGAAVKVIFEGEVSSVSSIADKTLVIVKHGAYITVYSNLESANVSKGQKVTRGQVIGAAGTNDDGVGEVELLITNDKGNYQNPELWIRRQ